MYRWVLVLVGVIGCGAVLKPPEPNRRLELHTGGSEFESNAGYRFASVPEKDADIVRLDVRYPVGSVDDPPGKEGLAHLVEHLLFDVEITRRDDKTSINAELGRLALTWNAVTTADYTDYQVIALPESLDALLQLETDRLAKGCGGISPAIFTREREVVLNELRERQGANGADVRRTVFEAIYPEGHPYRRVDSLESVSKLDFKDVCDFLAGPYRRGEVVVVASGDVDDQVFRQDVERDFAHVAKRNLAVKAPPPQVAVDHRALHVKADVEQPFIVVTWPLPPAHTLEARQLELVYEMLDSVLDADGMIWGWGRGADVTTLGGPSAQVLALTMTVTDGSHLTDLKRSLEASLAFSLRMLGEDSDSVLWRERWQAHAERYLARWENLGSRNDLVASQLAYGSADFLIGRIKELATTNPDTVRALGKKWLDLDRAKYIVVEPSGKAAGTKQLTANTSGEAAHLTAVDPSIADRPLIAPMPSDIKTIRYQLPNGLKIILWPHGHSSLVYSRLVVDAGKANDPPNAEGTAALMRPSSLYDDQIVYGDREISTRVDDAVRSVAMELRSPGYGLSDEAKKMLKAELRVERYDARRTYEQSLLAAVYGPHHPYARPEMSEQSVDHIHTDLITGWGRDHVVGSNTTLILTGEFDPELVKKHIAYNLDQVGAGKPTPELNAPLEPSGVQRVFGVTSQLGGSIELDVMFPGGRGIDDDHAARLVLAKVIENRLERLRGEKAVTYGFSADFEPRKLGGLWRISGKADAARAGEATTALLQILDEMRRDPESYRADFVLARQTVLESVLVNSHDSAAIAERLTLLARFGLPDGFYDRIAGGVADLRLSQLHAFLLRELPAQHQVFGAFGAREAVEAARAAAK